MGDLVAQRSVFVVEDLHDIALRLAEIKSNFHVIFSHPRMAPTTDKVPSESEMFFLSLSFFVRDGELNVYGTVDSLLSDVKKLRHDRTLLQVGRRNVSLFVRRSKTVQQSVELFQLFADCCDQFFSTSDVYDNTLSAYAHLVSKAFLQSHSDKYDVEQVCVYVKQNFSVSACYLIQNSKTNFLVAYPREPGVNLANVLKSDKVVTALGESIRRRQSYSGRVVVGRKKFYFKIFPVLYTRENTHVRGAVLLWKTGRQIRLSSARATKALIERVTSKKYLIGQPSFLEQARQRMDTELYHKLPRGIVNWQLANKHIEEYAQYLAKQTLICSSAASVVFRLFDPFTCALYPITWSQSPLGRYSRGAPKRIPLSKWRGSVNAFCFRTSLPGEYVYLPDVTEIPDLYRGSGLAQPLKARRHTASEICLPVYTDHLLIGTINIESPIRHAFAEDIPFFQSVARVFADYHQRICRSNDSEWLSCLSFRHVTEHNLRKLLDDRGLELSDAAAAKIRKFINDLQAQRFEPRSKALMQTSEYVTDAWNWLVNDIGELRHGLTAAEIVEVDPQLPKNLPVSVMSSLRAVIGNLLENSEKYSPRGTSDRLRVRKPLYECADRVLERTNMIELRYVSQGSIEGKLADDLFMMPLEKSSSAGIPRWHLGLFLVGVHVRLLGGAVYFRRSKHDDIPTRFEASIRLPLST